MRGIRRRTPSLLLLLPALLPACSDTASAEGGWVVRDSADITIVENDHEQPALESAPWRLSGTPVLQLGAVDGSEPEMLFQVTHSRRLAGGSIAVVSSGTSDVRLFDENGDHVRTLGRRGEGPGEFGSPWKIHELPGDSLLVIDLSGRVSVFRGDGTFVRRVRMEITEALIHAPGEPVGQFADGSLLYRGHYPSDPTWSHRGRNLVTMMRYDLDGTMLGAIGDFEDQTVDFGAETDIAFGPWAKAAAADSTMWYAPGDRLEIRKITFDGEVIRMVRLDRPRRPVTEADIQMYRELVLERARVQRDPAFLRRRLAATEYPSHFPAHFEILVDDVGNLWVQDYQQWGLRVPRRWAVFDPRGRYLCDVEVPPGIDVHQIGDDFLLGRWTDEMDVEYVRMYRLEKPAS